MLTLAMEVIRSSCMVLAFALFEVLCAANTYTGPNFQRMKCRKTQKIVMT
jgi:hypothetical protein